MLYQFLTKYWTNNQLKRDICLMVAIIDLLDLLESKIFFKKENCLFIQVH